MFRFRTISNFSFPFLLPVTSAITDDSTPPEASGNSTQSEASGSHLVIIPTEDFEYPVQPNLPYPTCRLSKGLIRGTDIDVGLADYAFLSALAYEPEDAVQIKLDQWFGPGVAQNEVEVVNNFRQEVYGGLAPVSYRLITFDVVNLGVVVVRGSSNSWEWLTNAQLWGGVAGNSAPVFCELNTMIYLNAV